MRAPALSALIALAALGSGQAAELQPPGGPGQKMLLGPGGPAAADVLAAVAADGFYAGPPIGAGACARCHPDVTAQWAASAHRFSSFDNPYYTAAARVFHEARGPDGFRFCADCHDPALAVLGPVDVIEPASVAAQAGIGCLVCHSIAAPPPPIGNALFTARLDPVPIGDGHGARVRPAGAADGRLCGSCHRVGLGPEVSGDRWRRGQDDHFGWADSPYAGGAAILETPEPASCVDCHMPRVPASRAERGAKAGRIRDHRALGAGTALARIRGDAAHEAASADFLRGAVTIELGQLEPATVDVILLNRNAGHPFPGGVNDSNQAWLEWRVWDAAGLELSRSGMLESGRLDPAAHLIRAQPVDPDGDPLAERAVHALRSVVYDTRLPPLAPRLVRLRLPPGAARIRARVLYRQFDADYAAFACAPLPAGEARDRCAAPPVTEVAAVEAPVEAGRIQLADDPERDLRHGLGLTEGLAADARAAEALLARVGAGRPDDPRPWLGRAKAAMALGQTDRALEMLDRAAAQPGASPIHHRLRAEALLAAYRVEPARAAAEPLAEALPGARATWRLLARARGLAGHADGALAAADRLLALDPEDPDGHYQRMLALAALDRRPEADRARALYLRHRRPDEAILRLRKAFRARHPARAPQLDAIPTHAL